MRELTLREVETMLKAGIKHAQANGHNSSLAVVDMGGHLRGALRPEKGRFPNVPIAEKKAWTAAAFQRPTHMLRERALPPGSAYGLQHTDNRVCLVAGGYPVIDEKGDILGGIGASGGPAALDQACCLAALRKAGFRTEFGDPLAAKKS